MKARTICALCLLPILMSALTIAVGQDEDTDKTDKKDTPRFFFEKGGTLKPAEGEEGEEGETEATPAREPERIEVAPAVPPVPAEFDFEDDAALRYWHAADGEAILDVTTAEGAARGGEGCLRLTYMPRPDAFQRITAGPLGDVEGSTLSFWVKTSLETNLTFGLAERGGGFYQQFCATPADEWTHVSVPLSSLVLSQDSQDPNFRLDVADITEIRISDLANLPGALGDALGRKIGVQQLYLDDLAIAGEEGLAAGEAPDAGLVDGFEGDSVSGLAIGGARLQKGEGVEGDGLEIVCETRTQRWMGGVLLCGHLDVADANALSLQMRATGSVMVSVNAEEWDNSKYEKRVQLDPADDWTSVEIPLDEMLLTTDSDDENGELDRQQIRVVVLVADMAGVEEFPITIGVDEVRFE